MPGVLSMLAASAISTPGSVSYATESTTLFAAMASQPSAARKGQIDTLIKALKLGATSNTNIWSGLDYLQVYAAHEAPSALLNWKAPGTRNATAVNSPDFLVDRGYASDGTSSYINTSHNILNDSVQYTKPYGEFGCWSLTDIQDSDALFGCFDGTAGVYLNPRNATDQAFARTATNSTQFLANNNGAGLFTAARVGNSAGQSTLYRNNASLGVINIVSSYVPNSQMKVGTVNTTAFNTSRVAMSFAGRGLTAAERTDLYNAFNAYLSAIGAV